MITNKWEEKCVSCGLEGEKYVECRGIYYCANKICMMSGATEHKKEADGISIRKDGKLEITDIVKYKAWCYLQHEQETDNNVKTAMVESLKKIERLHDKIICEEILLS